MGFVEKTDCKLSVSIGNANVLSTYKMKNIFLFTDVGRWGRGILKSDIFLLHI